MGARGREGFALVSAVLSLCLAPAARAQVSATVSLLSDYRFRGVSLSGRRPVGSLAIAYDHPSGAYVGVSVIGENLGGPKLLDSVEYLGFATPKTSGGLALDAGVSVQTLSQYAGQRRLAVDYSEVYVGLIGRRFSTHLYYAPNYFRNGNRTLYADVEGAMKPADDWRLFAHLGTTIPLGDLGTARHQRYDLRAGVAWRFHDLELQAAVTATSPAPPALSPQDRTALVVGASYSF